VRFTGANDDLFSPELTDSGVIDWLFSVEPKVLAALGKLRETLALRLTSVEAGAVFMATAL